MRNHFDYVVSTTNSLRDIDLSLQAVKVRGTIGILGFPGRNESYSDFNPFRSDQFYLKQLTYKALGMLPEINDSRGFLKFNERDNLKYVLGLMKRKIISHKIFLPKIYSYKDISKCYEELDLRTHHARTHLIKWF